MEKIYKNLTLEMVEEVLDVVGRDDYYISPHGNTGLWEVKMGSTLILTSKDGAYEMLKRFDEEIKRQINELHN